MPAEFLDARRAAAYLGVSRSTLLRWVAAGIAPRSVKTGPTPSSPRLFGRASLDLWLDERSSRTSGRHR